ncbi:Riboflavin biosynthesis protein RibBA, partial [Tetrabaena socialis]
MVTGLDADAGDIAAQGPSSVLYAQTASSSVDEGQVVTKFIAETLLPTRHGKFRLRGYKHSIDGGATFTEPTAIVAGVVEGGENVAVRVHDACFTSGRRCVGGEWGVTAWCYATPNA